MNAPAVSVILPTYNRAHLLPRAIASVLGQAFRDLELIVVDDGSTDGTAQVVAEIADPRLVFLPPERNLGDAGARNRGAARARGAWLAFQDSDDEWFPGKLEAQMAYAATLGEDFAAIGSTLVRYVGGPVEEWAWPLRTPGADRGEIDRHAFLLGHFAFLQSLVVRRDAFDRLGGFDSRLRARSDFDFCVRLIQEHRIAALAQPLALSHETPDSISLRPDYRRADIRHLLAQHGATIEADPRIAARYWYELARSEMLLGHAAACRQAALATLRRAPLSAKACALIGLSLFPPRLTYGAIALSQGVKRRLGRSLQ